MAGRGRGRGMSFSVETLGFGRGESLPGPIHEPPPLYPPLEYKPVPLSTGEKEDYILALKQELTGAMLELPYHIKPLEKKRDIERYSDKYQLNPMDSSIAWEPDWSRLPAELKIKVRRRTQVKATVQPKLVAAQPSGSVDITKTLEVLEKQEVVIGREEEVEEEKPENPDQEELLEEEYYDEEEMEDETDYNLTYFDNGENFGYDEDDDLDDGPTY